MRSQTLVREDKRAFTDFIRQVCFKMFSEICLNARCQYFQTLELGPQIWRHFIDPQNVAHIVQNFMEMLTAEISAGGGGGPTPDGLLAMLARVDPELNWAKQWLHRQSVQQQMMPKFAELVNEVFEHHTRPTHQEQAKYELTS